MNPDTNKLIEDHIPYAKAVAIKYGKEKLLLLEPEELISLGLFGLVQAAHSYNEQKDAKFKTYAWRRIRGEIQDYVKQETGYRRKPPKLPDISLERIVETGEFNKAFSTNGTEEKVVNKDILQKILAKMWERNAFVLRNYYLMGLTMKEIGQILGVTEGCISQIHEKAIGQARRINEFRL